MAPVQQAALSQANTGAGLERQLVSETRHTGGWRLTKGRSNPNLGAHTRPNMIRVILSVRFCGLVRSDPERKGLRYFLDPEQ
jgi:hypothetical protein